MKVLRAIRRFLRDHSGLLAATFGLIATYLASYVALIPPDKRMIPAWLAIFAGLCTLGFIASVVQQRAANAQAQAAEGLDLFGTYLIRYLYTGLENRPPFDWSKVITQDDAHDLFALMKMPISVAYTDPATGKSYRTEHELETFGKHVSVILKKQSEIPQ